ncbi:hypothetical protein C975_01245 [Brucella abortus CNGB 1011]|uniref:YihY/virulence factor BrkB family protein n=1 Tax=Brucella abortus TaxID=235 RepID=UPI0002CF69E5|nr:YihY/virulence factor BrkB family protein [Brucella abortus]ENP70269.1 hypothetical protein C975_01245 [Brucella abortus CNGB 1011]
MQKIRRFLRQITFDVWGHFSTDDGWAFASHIALSGLMALFPFLIFATSLASFLGTREFANTAVHVIFDMWPSNIAAPIANEVKSVLTVQRHGLLTVSVIAAAYSASNGVEALRIALNRAYRVTDQRSIIFCRLQSLGFVLVGTLSLMAISFLLVLALFMVHIWLPAGRRGLGDILPGIVITLIAWLAAATAFAKYLETFANYVSTYAGLASIMVAIVFLYMLSAIFIVGAEINAAIMIFRKREQQPNLNL